MQRMITMTLCVLLQVSCASNGNFIAQAERVPLPPPLNISSENPSLSVSLESVVIPDGPGSWVKQAAWDEYYLTFRNLSNVPITVESVQLVDSRGIYIDQGVNPDQLASISEAMMNQYRDLGVAVAIGVAPAVVSGVALTTGAFGTLVGAAALAPIALVAAPAYYFGSRYANQQDEDSIRSEFDRRNTVALTFSQQATYRGSVFFPIVPSPASLVINYRQGAEYSNLTLNLEQLLGLHVAPVQQ